MVVKFMSNYIGGVLKMTSINPIPETKQQATTKSTKREKYEKTAKDNSIKTDTLELSTKKDQKRGHTFAIASGTLIVGGLIGFILERGRSAGVLNYKIEKGVEEKLAGQVKPYQDEILSIKNKLNAIIEEKTGKPVDQTLLGVLKKEVEEYKLDYDPKSPPNREFEENRKEYISLDDYKPTSNRSQMKGLDVPKFIPGHDWKFQVPIPSDSSINPVKESHMDFSPISDTTNISLDYADSVLWNNDKITRDILQNFYDGHGQTLDGVNFDVKHIGGRYKVRIEGKGLYTPDKAVLVGESSKKNISEAAGNYGEGLKMTVLKLLKDAGANEVLVGSGDWNASFKIGKSKLGGKNVLAYSVDKAPVYDGNYLEFEIDKPDFIDSLSKSINRFYHSNNKDFKSPSFENSQFGIRALNKMDKGGVYLAGQKIEYLNDFEGLEGLTIFFKHKSPMQKIGTNSDELKPVFDLSRDRISLNYSSLYDIVKTYAMDEKTTEKELAYAIKSIENLWEKNFLKSSNKAVLDGLLFGAKIRNIKINFPEKYLADSDYIDLEQIMELKSCGYTICDSGFEGIGMTSVREYILKARNHNAFQPTEVEVKKIAVIRKALQSLSAYLDNKDFFNKTELNPKIYLFDAKNSNESKTYEYVQAEAIIDRTKGYFEPASVGFWLDRKYLNKASFSEILATALHEISHKVGGDGSSTFGYKLTDVLGKEIQSRIEDSSANIELKNLRKIWDEFNPKRT